MGASFWELPPRPAQLLLPHVSCCLPREASWDDVGYSAGFMHFRGGRGRKVYGCVYEEHEIICIR